MSSYDTLSKYSQHARKLVNSVDELADEINGRGLPEVNKDEILDYMSTHNLSSAHKAYRAMHQEIIEDTPIDRHNLRGRVKFGLGGE